jgi:hypothetical protein
MTMSDRRWIWGLGFLLAVLLGGWVIGRYFRGAPMASMPIAVMDRGQLLKTLDQNTTEETRAITLQKFESAARRLADAGYLVIDRGWVIAAPEEFYVDPD